MHRPVVRHPAPVDARTKARDLLHPELAEHGNGPGRGNKRVYIINSFTGGGTSEAYLIRRLKRDRLDLHAKSAPAGPL